MPPGLPCNVPSFERMRAPGLPRLAARIKTCLPRDPRSFGPAADVAAPCVLHRQSLSVPRLLLVPLVLQMLHATALLRDLRRLDVCLHGRAAAVRAGLGCLAAIARRRAGNIAVADSCAEAWRDLGASFIVIGAHWPRHCAAELVGQAVNVRGAAGGGDEQTNSTSCLEARPIPGRAVVGRVGTDFTATAVRTLRADRSARSSPPADRRSPHSAHPFRS